MKLQRRDTEVFSLSFLDCICCGFGAVILLLVLSEFGQPVVIEKSREQLDGQAAVNRRRPHLQHHNRLPRWTLSSSSA